MLTGHTAQWRSAEYRLLPGSHCWCAYGWCCKFKKSVSGHCPAAIIVINTIIEVVIIMQEQPGLPVLMTLMDIKSAKEHKRIPYNGDGVFSLIPK